MIFSRVGLTSVLTVLFAQLFFAAGAQAHMFKNLEGSWKGKGTILTASNAEKEAIRCRLINRFDAKKIRLNLAGNCGIAGVILPMTGWFQREGKSNKYKASLFKSLAIVKVNSFIGKLKGSKLFLSFEGRDKVNKLDITAKVTVHSRNKDKFEIKLGRTDPLTRKFFTVGTIKFNRK